MVLIILLVSFFLRFWKLSSYPVSLSIDEVIIGYDSYSILKTAKDHWGEFLPLAFKSVGDYKAPILVYLMIPAIKFLGLSEFSIRFTVALLGSLTPLVVYSLVNLLLNNKRIALIGAFLLAISPWHIQYSRLTHEAIIALLFFLLGCLVFIGSLKNKGKFWWLSGIFFCLSIYSYHSERIFVPVFLVSLLLVYRKEIWTSKKNALMALMVAVILSLPMVHMIFSSKGLIRPKSVFITNDYELRTLRWEKISQWEKPSFVEMILNGKATNAFSFWIKRYLEYSDFSFLFFKGMSFTHPKFPDVGLMYLIELPFFVLGAVVLVNKMKIEKGSKRLVFIWALLGPLSASLANNSQHTSRSLTLVPIPQILVAVGAWYFIQWLRGTKIRSVYQMAISLAIIMFGLSNIYGYLDLYYVHCPVHYSHYWMYGMKEVSLYLWQNKDNYDQIIIDPDFGVEAKNITGIPFAYLLVYGKVEPAVIQKARLGRGEFGFENFVFRNVYWPEDRHLKNTLLVASFWQLSPQEIPSSQIVKVVSLYNKMPMFYLVKTSIW